MSLPQRHGFVVHGHLVVAAEDADPHLAAVDAEAVGQLQRPGDGVGLEVVAKREVAEHLEKGEVPRGLAHVLDVRGTKTALAGGEARGGRRVDAEEVGLVLLHAGGREEDAGVAGGHEAGGLADEVPFLDEEVSEQVADVGGVHVGPRVVWGGIVYLGLSPEGRRIWGLSSSPISSRSFSSERLMRRDTCICEMPTRSAIWLCVWPSKKRRCRM